MSTNIEKIRHSLAHLMAMAVLEKFPNAKLGIGPVIETGFYYDFDLGKSTISPEDLPELEKRVKELMKADLSFKKEFVSAAEAKKIFKDQPYKLELIKELQKEKKTITVYKTAVAGKNKSSKDNRLGEFVDLCAGPHVKSTKEIKPDVFKIFKIAGAYWRGDEKNPMLTRIYGLGFETKAKLEEHLKFLEEAEKRDHRILGEKLELFMIDEKIGKGLPLWLPKGYLVRKLIEDYIYNFEKENGYQHVLTPQLAKEDLYKTSGHLAHYKDDMYAPIVIENEKYYLRPMNCPHHHSIYKNKLRSYRDLPLRVAEFGTVYRFERSGTLSGLIRVRGFTQNDSHIYTAPETLGPEITSVLKMIRKVYDDFNIRNYWFRLSLPDFKNKEKYGDVKNKKMWNDGAAALESALKNLKINYVEGLGEASFYGPKIDIQIKNIYGKEETIATIQVDYYSAPRFNLSYIGKDGKEKPPVIIHRAILGSFDRFFAFLLEQTAGDLPLWLAPVQTIVVPVGEKFNAYGEKVLKALKENGIRAELDQSNEKLGKKIREAELKKIPYVLIVGEREEASKKVSIRRFQKGQQGDLEIDDFIVKIKKEIEEKL